MVGLIKYKKVVKFGVINSVSKRMEFEFTYESFELNDTIHYRLRDTIYADDHNNYLLSPVLVTELVLDNVESIEAEIFRRADMLAEMLSTDLGKLSDRLALTKQAYLKFISREEETSILPPKWFIKEEELTTELERNFCKNFGWLDFDKFNDKFIVHLGYDQSVFTIGSEHLDLDLGYYLTLNQILCLVNERINLQD